MAKRFVVMPVNYHGCPICESGSTYDLIGFETPEELIKEALIQYPDTAFELIYDTEQEIELEIVYEKGRHSFTGMVIKRNGIPIQRTVDNGSGVLIIKDIE